MYQLKAWNMAAKHQGTAIFATLTPNENGSSTVSFYAGEILARILLDITLNDIPDQDKRAQIAGRDPFAVNLFFTNMIELSLETVPSFDSKTNDHIVMRVSSAWLRLISVVSKVRLSRLFIYI